MLMCLVLLYLCVKEVCYGVIVKLYLFDFNVIEMFCVVICILEMLEVFVSVILFLVI